MGIIFNRTQRGVSMTHIIDEEQEIERELSEAELVWVYKAFPDLMNPMYPVLACHEKDLIEKDIHFLIHPVNYGKYYHFEAGEDYIDLIVSQNPHIEPLRFRFSEESEMKAIRDSLIKANAFDDDFDINKLTAIGMEKLPLGLFINWDLSTVIEDI